MSLQQQEKGRESGIRQRAIVISRSDPTARNNRSSSAFSSRSSVSMRSSLTPGVIQQLSSSGITDFRGSREKEKREMQDLNERLAGYIEKVHFLGGQCKKLEAENEALRNRKQEDLEPIRRAYENELAQARKVIDDLSSAKGTSEAKLAGMQDEIASLRDLIVTYENQAKDYRKKIESLGNQLGEYEGELHTLRLRVGSLEDENAKVRELLEKIQYQNRGLRSDLDQETSAHIEAECMAQTKTEEAAFYKDLLDQLELLKPEPITIKGMDTAEFWNSQMKKCLREINSAYDEKIDLIQQDCEAKYSAQLNSMKSGNVKDNLQLNNAQEEVKRMRSQLSDRNAAFAELQAKLAGFMAERDELNRQWSEMENELGGLRAKYSHDVGDLENELQGVLAQFQVLMDAKMSLELEIACYKKLLETEESRVGLRSLVEQAIGTQGKGASALAETLQQSKSTGSLTVQRSSKGPVGFATVDHTGGNVVLENTGSRAKLQNIKGWKIVKTAAGSDTIVIVLKDYDFPASSKFTIWASGAKKTSAKYDEQLAENFSFGMGGNCVWQLTDEAGNHKAQLTAKFSG